MIYTLNASFWGRIHWCDVKEEPTRSVVELQYKIKFSSDVREWLRVCPHKCSLTLVAPRIHGLPFLVESRLKEQPNVTQHLSQREGDDLPINCWLAIFFLRPTPSKSPNNISRSIHVHWKHHRHSLNNRRTIIISPYLKSKEICYVGGCLCWSHAIKTITPCLVVKRKNVLFPFTFG